LLFSLPIILHVRRDRNRSSLAIPKKNTKTKISDVFLSIRVSGGFRAMWTRRKFYENWREGKTKEIFEFFAAMRVRGRSFSCVCVVNKHNQTFFGCVVKFRCVSESHFKQSFNFPSNFLLCTNTIENLPIQFYSYTFKVSNTIKSKHKHDSNPSPSFPTAHFSSILTSPTVICFCFVHVFPTTRTC
jgi:hypothetical protein